MTHFSLPATPRLRSTFLRAGTLLRHNGGMLEQSSGQWSFVANRLGKLPWTMISRTSEDNVFVSLSHSQLSNLFLGGGFQVFFYVHPDPWGNDPIWRAYFSRGLVQPPTSHFLQFSYPCLYLQKMPPFEDLKLRFCFSPHLGKPGGKERYLVISSSTRWTPKSDINGVITL